MGNLQLAPGTLYANRFAIERAAGSGRMGTVYRATDSCSGEVVALKLLNLCLAATAKTLKERRSLRTALASTSPY